MPRGLMESIHLEAVPSFDHSANNHTQWLNSTQVFSFQQKENPPSRGTNSFNIGPLVPSQHNQVIVGASASLHLVQNERVEAPWENLRDSKCPVESRAKVVRSLLSP
ncbi:hypothetical protein TNCV_948791 [Trichonephila clavipes]|nr:hypothetical protein TNCV_948791 [Trichonephila clavipes]